MYRTKDLNFLQDIFDRSSNDIAVLYGKRQSGLSEMVSDFIKDKDCLYYRACAVNDTVQRQLFGLELHEQTRTPVVPEEDYDRLIGSYLNGKGEKKKLIVLDEFDHLIKENPTLINFLSSLLFKQNRDGIAMILLVSDNISWVENDMVKAIGRRSSEISGVIKLNEYSPTEFAECFPGLPIAEVMGIYSFLGGKSLYYNDITEDSTMRGLIIQSLERWSADDHNPAGFLPSAVREPAHYNTILVSIANGSGKLNDLYKNTGIDRAKLAVYLKNLSDYDIVFKAVSAQVGDSAGTLKGVYKIKDRQMLFYYRFVFPRISSLKMLGAERFYRRFIEHEIMNYMEEAYPLFCMEQVRWLQNHDRLNFKVASIEEYYDKKGVIDFVVVAAGGSVIACSCRYAPPHMSYRVYEEVKAVARKNKMICDNIWLFSASGFDQKLSMFGSVTPGVKLIDGSMQRLR